MEGLFDVIIEVILYTSLLLPILFFKGFIRNNKAFKYFAFYLVIIAIIQFLMRMYKLTHGGESTLFFFVYYFVLQFIFLSFFYQRLLGFRWVNYVTIIALTFVTCQYILDPEMYFRYNPIGSALTQIIIVVYSLLYFYKSLTGRKDFIIINVGVFFYFLSSILIFVSGNLVLDEAISESVPRILNRTNLILFLVFQILIVIEWWRNYRLKVSKN